MEDDQRTEHLGNELLGDEADFVEMEPAAPDDNVHAVTARQGKNVATNKRKEGIYIL